jgi:branched-chain amino acid transport system permease protein
MKERAIGKDGIKEWVKSGILGLILLLMQPILPSDMMAAEILIMALPTLAFILLLGYTGQLNFGTGSLFAVGAYTCGILLSRYEVNTLVAIATGLFLSGVISAIVGFFCIRQGGLIFALLTLAFNQIIWFIILQWRNLTGGPDGIWGIERKNIAMANISLSIDNSFNFYVLVVLIFLATFIFVRRLIDSPFGKVIQGFRDSELRATAIGYNPTTYKWIIFIITGMICGLGGSLFALHQEYVGEHLAHWSTGGEVVIMALLGGTFSIYGALIGSGTFIFLSDLLNQYPSLARGGGWLLIMGILFILVVLFLREGLYGGLTKFARLLLTWKEKRMNRIDVN